MDEAEAEEEQQPGHKATICVERRKHWVRLDWETVLIITFTSPLRHHTCIQVCVYVYVVMCVRDGEFMYMYGCLNISVCLSVCVVYMFVSVYMCVCLSLGNPIQQKQIHTTQNRILAYRLTTKGDGQVRGLNVPLPPASTVLSIRTPIIPLLV